MSADELRRMRALQEAQAAQIQRMNLELQAQKARHEDVEEEFEHVEQPQHQQYQQHQQYNQVNHDQMIMNQLANVAAEKAAQKVQQNLTSHQNVKDSITKRMERLVAEYPAIQEEDSLLTTKAREVYARITAENPTINEADKYELAVREAASRIGARPVNTEFDVNQDFTMPSNSNPARASARSGKLNRLNDNIIKNAMALGVNVDPKTKEGQENLKELNEYSARFNADQDETAYRYR